MSNLHNTDEFITFSRKVIENDLTPFNMTVELEVSDLEDLKKVVLDFLDADSISEGDNVAYLLDDLREIVQSHLDEMDMEILKPNLYNDNYEFIQWPDTDNPLENVRRSLVSAGGGDVSELLRDKVEKETGKDPYNESWDLV